MAIPERAPQELVYTPALLLIGLVMALRWRRKDWHQPGMPHRREASGAVA